MGVHHEAPESQFAFVVVAARRARQLMAGARPLMDVRATKPTRIAMAELRHGVLEYEMPALPGSAEEDEKEGKRVKE